MSRINKPKAVPDLIDAQILTAHILNHNVSMQSIAHSLDVSEATVSRRIAAFKDSSWFQKLVPRLEGLAPIAYRNVAKALESGSYEATRDYLRGLNVYDDKRKIQLDLSDPSVLRSLFERAPSDTLRQIAGTADDGSESAGAASSDSQG